MTVRPHGFEAGAGRGLGAVAAALAAILAAGCGGARPLGPGGPWESPLDREHPLVGRVWDTRAQAFIDPATLAGRLARGRFVLLGEKHDNPDHHRLQAWIIRELGAAGRRPAVAFEMFTPDQADALAAFLAAKPRDTAGLGAALGWERTGWPPWPHYQAIADAALAGGMPILPANLSRSQVQGVVRQGVSALGEGAVARLGLDRPLAPEVRAAMAREIREGHCDQVPEHLLDGMIAVQRARDAHMAERLATAGPEGAVLIAGAGHVRSDWGVPAFLALHAPGAPAISVAFLEVRRDMPEPRTYASEFNTPALPVDYVWFTPRLEHKDPCEKYRVPLERLRRRGPASSFPSRGASGLPASGSPGGARAAALVEPRPPGYPHAP